MLLENLGHRVIKRFQRRPTPVEKIIPAGMKFPPGRHAGQAAGIEGIKGHGLGCKTREIRGLHPVIAIGFKGCLVQ
ncbi:hypothetical protein SDC9_66139 [bioreactor metagenome]|uniref:Uncharacterized protein n=1 Tax=bioreactor metagenome TaxID=1076179 RepID=A0A644XZL4_9ZZZZ